MNFLGQLHHPNLVKLIGYCCEDDQRLLVYEFMPRGSLENHLFRSKFYLEDYSKTCIHERLLHSKWVLRHSLEVHSTRFVGDRMNNFPSYQSDHKQEFE